MVDCRPTQNIKSFNSLVLCMWGEHCSGFNLIGRKVHQEIMNKGFSWLPSTQEFPRVHSVLRSLSAHTTSTTYHTERGLT